MSSSKPKSPRKWVRITHQASGTPLAEGPVGWNIMPFEGNFYVRRKFLRTDGFKVNFIPGLCSYKFLYVWMDLLLAGGERIRNLAWMYWLPNPLFPFIWFRVGIPQHHPELAVEYSTREAAALEPAGLAPDGER